MVIKKVSDQKSPLNIEAETIRQDVLHLLVDLNLHSHGSKQTLARMLSVRLGQQVSRNTVAMALSAYRTSHPYIHYLTELRAVLQYRKDNNVTAVSYYTNNQNNQDQKETHHG